MANIKKNRREDFLKAGIQCIQKVGIQNTNSYTVTAKLGVSQSSFFYHFQSQKEFWRDLFAYVISTGVKIIESLPKKERQSHWVILQNRISGNLRWAEKYPAHIDLLAFGFLNCQEDKSLAELSHQTILGGERSFYGIITAGFAEGEFTLNLPAASVTKIITKATLGAMLDLNTAPDRKKRRLILEKDLIDLVSFLLAPRR